MCILVTGTASDLNRVLKAHPELVMSIYDHNSDGIGVMYPSDDGVPLAHKALPPTVADLGAWLDSVMPTDGRPMALHARFATHGNKDLDNCHPYPVDGGYLMHNGVLATGNKPKPDKSDTWHYARWFLDGQADTVFGTESGRYLLGHHIGTSNRFAYLDSKGQLHIVNKSTGVEYEGLWFSNTYAWDVEILDPTFRERYRYGSWSTSKLRVTGDPREAEKAGRKSAKKSAKVFSRADMDKMTDEELDALVEGSAICDDEAKAYTQYPGVQGWADQYDSVVWLLEEDTLLPQALEDCGAELVRSLIGELGEPAADLVALGEDESGTFDEAVNALVDMDAEKLDDIARNHPIVLADALQYGVIWPVDAAAEADMEEALASDDDAQAEAKMLVYEDQDDEELDELKF